MWLFLHNLRVIHRAVSFCLYWRSKKLTAQYNSKEITGEGFTNEYAVVVRRRWHRGNNRELF